MLINFIIIPGPDRVHPRFPVCAFIFSSYTARRRSPRPRGEDGTKKEKLAVCSRLPQAILIDTAKAVHAMQMIMLFSSGAGVPCLTLFGSAGDPVRLQDVSLRAAASVRPVGVHAGLAACAIHGTFIMILWKRKESHL